MPDNPLMYQGVAPATLTITLPDGAGGYQDYPLPYFGAGTEEFNPGVYWNPMLVLGSLLNSIWGTIVCAGYGDSDTPVTGTGSASWGLA